MAQIKIFGARPHLDPIKRRLSGAVHACIVEVLQLPPDKRFHRFCPLDEAVFFYPPDRSAQYTIIEISMVAGRSAATKKQVIHALFDRVATVCRAAGSLSTTINIL